MFRSFSSVGNFNVSSSFSAEYENEKKLFHFSEDSSKSEVAISLNVKIHRKRKIKRTRLGSDIDRGYEMKTDKKMKIRNKMGKEIY